MGRHCLGCDGSHTTAPQQLSSPMGNNARCRIPCPLFINRIAKYVNAPVICYSPAPLFRGSLLRLVAAGGFVGPPSTPRLTNQPAATGRHALRLVHCAGPIALLDPHDMYELRGADFFVSLAGHARQTAAAAQPI